MYSVHFIIVCRVKIRCSILNKTTRLERLEHLELARQKILEMRRRNIVHKTMEYGFGQGFDTCTLLIISFNPHFSTFSFDL